MGVKKAEAARILNVSKARVSQYVKEGMPQLPDGTIDLQAASAWIRDNIDPAKRAGWLAGKPRQQAGPDPFAVVGDFAEPAHGGFAFAVANAVYTAPAYAVVAAADAGVSRDQARKLAQHLMVLVWCNLEYAARAIGMPTDANGEVFALELSILQLKLDQALAEPGRFGPDGSSLVAGRSAAP